MPATVHSQVVLSRARRAIRVLNRAKMRFIDLYDSLDSSTGWTPEQETELQEAVDDLTVAKQDVCTALNEATTELMACINSGGP